MVADEVNDIAEVPPLPHSFSQPEKFGTVLTPFALAPHPSQGLPGAVASLSQSSRMKRKPTVVVGELGQDNKSPAKFKFPSGCTPILIRPLVMMAEWTCESPPMRKMMAMEKFIVVEERKLIDFVSFDLIWFGLKLIHYSFYHYVKKQNVSN